MVYNYTKPRGPIAAMYSSPGPCYNLPGLVGYGTHDPRSVHGRNPQWSFGVRHGQMGNDCSPGPCYLPDSKIYRNGKDGTPHYSLYSRTTDGKLFGVPGPGAYKPETTIPYVFDKAPQYSFGLRHRNRKSDDVPGPNHYKLDPMIGRTYRSEKVSAASYSLTGRSKIGSFHEDLRKTPGPGTYSVTDPNIFKDRLPLYSMTSRHPPPGDTTTKPGPGAHKPEGVCINKRAAPQFSFGIRHSQYKGEMITDADAA
ncbi:Outer dense fiber protein 3 [Cichlidogyrus casuarinus]|uniref:Outer dense fiber protein 3 n=1 Tax=Cichlidogyrus casuarinus TaxID=1844966 RepID=A0ABD2PYZ4_9PLAT